MSQSQVTGQAPSPAALVRLQATCLDASAGHDHRSSGCRGPAVGWEGEGVGGRLGVGSNLVAGL